MSSQTVYFTNPSVITGIQSNITSLQTSVYNSAPYLSTGSVNVMNTYTVNQQNTNQVQVSSTNYLTPETVQSLKCKIQKVLGYTQSGKQIKNIVSSFNGVFDEDYFYDVCQIKTASYLGSFPQGVLLGLDLQAYGNEAIIVKIKRSTGEVVAAKTCAEITGYPNQPTINSILDTGDSSTRGPLEIYGDYIYLSGQDTRWNSVYKISKSDLSLVTYQRLPDKYQKIVTSITGAPNGQDFTGPYFKSYEAREVMVIPPQTSEVRPGLDSDFYNYPLVLVSVTSNNTYTYVQATTVNRYQIFNRWFRASGTMIAYLDKGVSGFEKIWEFSMAPDPLQKGQALPETWFAPTGAGFATGADQPYVVIPLYDGFRFTDFSTTPTYKTSDYNNVFISKESGNNNIFKGQYTLEDGISAFVVGNGVGTISFTDGQVFDKNNMYTINLYGTGGYDAGIVGTGSVTGTYLLGQPIRLFVNSSFIIPTGTLEGVVPGDVIATNASHYGGGLWCRSCWDPKLGFLYIAGGNNYNNPEYERQIYNWNYESTKANQNYNDKVTTHAYSLMNNQSLETKIEYTNTVNSATYGTLPDINTSIMYQDIVGAETGASVVRQAGKDYVDFIISNKNKNLSSRNKRLLGTSVSAIDPYSKTGAGLKWTYKMIEGGAWSVDAVIAYPGGILRNPNTAFYGQGDLNMDVLQVSLVNLTSNPTGPRCLVAQSKGLITLLNPDAYYNTVAVNPSELDMKSGIVSCQPPLFNSTSTGAGNEMSFIMNSVNYIQFFPGQMAATKTLKGQSGRNLLISKASGRQFGYQKLEASGPRINTPLISLPFARGSENRIGTTNAGNLTCFDLDYLCGFNGTTYSYQLDRNSLVSTKAVIWQKPLEGFGNPLKDGLLNHSFSNGWAGPRAGPMENTSFKVYGDIIIVGNNNGTIQFFDQRNGREVGKIATCEPQASSITIANNQLMLIGGYDKWNNDNTQLGLSYYTFTPNGM